MGVSSQNGQWAALFGPLGVKQTDSEAVVTESAKRIEQLFGYMAFG